jgi:hypothetical protein
MSEHTITAPRTSVAPKNGVSSRGRAIAMARALMSACFGSSHTDFCRDLMPDGLLAQQDPAILGVLSEIQRCLVDEYLAKVVGDHHAACQARQRLCNTQAILLSLVHAALHQGQAL